MGEEEDKLYTMKEVLHALDLTLNRPELLPYMKAQLRENLKRELENEQSPRIPNQSSKLT